MSPTAADLEAEKRAADSRAAADLEVDLIVASQMIKRGVPFVELHGWNRRLVPVEGGGVAVIRTIPAQPMPQQPVTPTAPDASAELPTPGNPALLMGDIEKAMARGDMGAVQQLLAGEGLRLVALTTDGETQDGPTETPG